MRCKDSSLKRTLEAMTYDIKLSDFILTVDTGDAAIEVEDVEIDMSRRIISFKMSNNVLYRYSDKYIHKDEEGVLSGNE